MAYFTYKYRIYPNNNQTYAFNAYFDLCSYLRNEYRKDLSNNEKLPKLAVDVLDYYLLKFPFLAQASRGVLINEIFKIYKGHSKNSFSFSNLKNLQSKYPIQDKKFFVPGIGWIKKENNRLIENTNLIKSYCVKEEMGKYYLNAILVIPDIKKDLNIDSIIGFDYSSTHFLIDNYGNQYDIPYFQKESKSKIYKKLKRIRNCKKGSKTYKRIKSEISNIYRHERNRRMDTLHKISSTIVKTYDYIVIEDLCMKEIASFHNLHNKTYSNSFFQFSKMLVYKAQSNGKKVIKVDRYFPSSKTCHVCGNINRELSINDRVWECSKCGTKLDRDINSAINIKNEGLKIIAGGQSACL